MAVLVHRVLSLQVVCATCQRVKDIGQGHMAKAASKPFELPATERERMLRMMRAGSTPQRLARRCAIAWYVSRGLPERAIADKVGVSRRTVVLWKRRFLESGVEALLVDRPGRGRRRAPGDSDQAVRRAGDDHGSKGDRQVMGTLPGKESSGD